MLLNYTLEQHLIIRVPDLNSLLHKTETRRKADDKSEPSFAKIMVTYIVFKFIHMIMLVFEHLLVLFC